MTWHDVTISDELKPHITEEEGQLLVKMWRLVAKRNHYEKQIEEYDSDCRHLPLYKDLNKTLRDTREELAKQRKITLGKLYYSNRKVWKFLTSRYSRLTNPLK